MSGELDTIHICRRHTNKLYSGFYVQGLLIYCIFYVGEDFLWHHIQSFDYMRGALDAAEGVRGNAYLRTHNT